MPRVKAFGKRKFTGNIHTRHKHFQKNNETMEAIIDETADLMPRKRSKGKVTFQDYSPERLNNALKAIRIDKRRIREVGRSFKIPESTLRKYLKSNELPIKSFGRRRIVLENESSDSSVYIKQEVMEPVIEMLEGAPDMKEPFEGAYLDSDNHEEMLEGAPDVKEPFEDTYVDPNNHEYNNEDLLSNRIIKVKSLNESEEEIIVPDVFPESIKAEPLDIIDEQTIATAKCPECGEDFEGVWSLERHFNEKHFINESIKILTETLAESRNKPRKVSKSLTQTVSPSSSKALSLFSVTTTTCSRFTCSPTTHMNGTIQSVPHPLPSLITPVSTAILDSSETFVISLAPFPKSKRVTVKEKILQFVEQLLKGEL